MQFKAVLRVFLFFTGDLLQTLLVQQNFEACDSCRVASVLFYCEKSSSHDFFQTIISTCDSCHFACVPFVCSKSIANCFYIAKFENTCRGCFASAPFVYRKSIANSTILAIIQNLRSQAISRVYPFIKGSQPQSLQI